MNLHSVGTNSPFHSNMFVPKGHRSHELMMLDTTRASQPREGGRAPLRPATAAELGARRHCRPRRSCRLPEREPLLRHQPGSAHSSSATPFSTKAQNLLVERICGRSTELE